MERACEEASPEGSESRKPLDTRIAELAARQHGVVAVRQLAALGLSPAAARQRAAAGRLHRVERGVYAVGHPRLRREGRWNAAVLTCGETALLSHRSSAALWALRPPHEGRVEVSIRAGAGTARTGLRVYRTTTLTPADTAVVEGIPCTSVERTLVDMAAVVGPGALASALDRAETLRICDAHRLTETLDRAGPRRGVGALRALLAERWEPAFTRQELEARFLAICRESDLPLPRVNHHLTVAGTLREVDFCWPELGVVIETDGHRDHGGRAAFEADRCRDQDLIANGWRVVRFTWRQVVHEPGRVLEILRRLLGELAR